MQISWDFPNYLGAGESGKSTIFKQARPSIIHLRYPKCRNEVNTDIFSIVCSIFAD